MLEAPSSNQIAQSPNENEIAELAKFLKNNGVEVFTKNIYGQGVVTRVDYPVGDASLHVANLNDLERAKELVSVYFKKKNK